MIKDIIKKWYFWLVIILFIIVIPLVISCIYLIGYKNSLDVNTMISAGDAFLGYGALLSFAGSTFLGAIAIWQNRALMDYQKNQIKKSEKSLFVAEQVGRNELVTTETEGYNSIRTQIFESDLVYHINNIITKITNHGEAVSKSLTIHYYLVTREHPHRIRKHSFTQNFVLAPKQTKYISIPTIEGYRPDGFALEVDSMFSEKMFAHFFITSIGKDYTVTDYQILADIKQVDDLVEKITNMRIEK